MGMWGGRTELKLAKSYLPAFACPIMQANMELGLKGAYQGISAVIIPTMCDTLRCMTQNWRFGMKDIPMIPIVYPQNRTSPASVDYLISEFETVLTILYTITGNMVSEKSMEEAIAVYNQHNATMREFDRRPTTTWTSSPRRCAMWFTKAPSSLRRRAHRPGAGDHRRTEGATRTPLDRK